MTWNGPCHHMWTKKAQIGMRYREICVWRIWKQMGTPERLSPFCKGRWSLQTESCHPIFRSLSKRGAILRYKNFFNSTPNQTKGMQIFHFQLFPVPLPTHPPRRRIFSLYVVVCAHGRRQSRVVIAPETFYERSWTGSFFFHGLLYIITRY